MGLLIFGCYALRGFDKDKSEHLRSNMQSFVLAGKAKTVFRLIELKAKQEALARRLKEQDNGKRK